MDCDRAAKQFAEKLDSTASGAKALTEKVRLYRSAESAAPPKPSFQNGRLANSH
jgi:hypothetical protein